MKKLKDFILPGIILIAFAIPFTSFSWNIPKLTALCQVTPTHYEFEITLVPEPNQIIEFSYDSSFTVIVLTKDFVTDGTFPVSIGASKVFNLYARYQSDHNAKTSVAVNSNLCTPPVATTTPSVAPTMVPAVTNTQSSSSGSCLKYWPNTTNYTPCYQEYLNMISTPPTKLLPPEPVYVPLPTEYVIPKCKTIYECKG